jgi:proteic killer suppression protein
LIRHFRCKDTEALYNGFSVKRFKAFESPARKRLLWLDAAATLLDLAAIRGNHLKSLKGDRSGQYSIRINDPWRICFKWREGYAQDVEIVDYH